MNWTDIGSKIGKMAPLVGTLLGGPAGGAVGALVATALGTDNNPDAVSTALLTDPGAQTKIAELQINAKVQLQQLAVSAELNRMNAEAAQYAAEVSDRDSARALAAKQPNDVVRPAIVFTLLAGALLIIGFIFTGSGRAIMADPVATLTIGTIIGLWFNQLKEATGFYFGMTKDAARQNMDLTRMAGLNQTQLFNKDVK